MPFIHSVSGLPRKESSNSSLPSMANKGREDRGGSVKERISLNLKHLGKKGEAEGSGGGGANGGAAGRRRPDKANNRAPKHTDGITTARAAGQAQGGVKVVGAELRSRLEGPEEAHFTLTLTPEAVLLLQKRSSERNQRAGSGGAADAKVNGRRRDAPSKRPQPGTQRRGSEAQVDIRSILKVSLLNDRHKYDDVEYEEEEEYALDQRVVLKCTEWLRGLESPLTTVGEAVGCKSSGKSC